MGHVFSLRKFERPSLLFKLGVNSLAYWLYLQHGNRLETGSYYV